MLVTARTEQLREAILKMERLVTALRAAQQAIATSHPDVAKKVIDIASSELPEAAAVKAAPNTN